MSLNHITLVGQVVHRPELRKTPTGVSIAEFSVAVRRAPRPDGSPSEEQDQFRVQAWEKWADRAAEVLEPGALISLEGRLVARSFEAQGQRRKVVEIRASAFETIGVVGPSAVPHSASKGAVQESASAFDDFDTPDAFGSGGDDIPF